ncbi:GRASP55/65 PDZ-like domain-containing protein [Phanerochaete sordida]|uniref:GRASP55/65 PDZ-like domain-containing protein n=1 Tax=Phanerochaete sordida TaxID=48140 RepID=A0A9P3LC04_9APHY|nr:GRASP55/65 PDZ-like domain-containing protein [Phanerochaete sordida]
MGAGQSTASKVPPKALHVLRVTPSSPASQTSIEPYFDFVVGFKDKQLASGNIDAAELERIVEAHEGRPLDLLVWNSKSQSVRVVPIVPSRTWSMPFAALDPKEPDAAERKPSLLGLSMRMCEPEFAMENVWHVLDVLEGSPAESAGLVPYGDWIIGWSGGVLSTEGDFYEVVEAHIEKPLRVFVYSYDFDNIREVVLVPNRHWGGEGLLGCVFGFGLLHRIPPLPENREPGSLPLELAETQPEYEEHQMFVPADVAEDVDPTEQEQERLRWEYEQAEYARQNGSYYNSSPSAAYDRPPDVETRHYRERSASGHSDVTVAVEETPHTSPVPASVPNQVAVPVASQAAPPRSTPTILPRPATPLRSPAFSPPLRPGTPTQTRAFGLHSMNGLGIRPRTPSWDTRMFDATSRGSTTTHDEELADEHDGVSVAGTEATDTSGTSETTSQGSLTSVD